MRKLATYATEWQKSRGRTVTEPEAVDRSPFQRDRDRIIHSEAFRRLQYKTQVFVNHEGDHYRTRLTHTIEVAQITRDICRALGLDDDLGETVALAHDMGHPPFGHSGEDALNEAMKDFGGFRHNEQTLRVIRQLEARYPDFDGLNLTWESLEGIAKHNGPLKDDELKNPLFWDLDGTTWSGLEAQVAAMSDDIAYNHHDLEDGLRAEMLTIDQVIAEIPGFAERFKALEQKYHGTDHLRLARAAIGQMISAQVHDLVTTTTANLTKNNIQTVEDARAHAEGLVDFSIDVKASNKALKKFLFENMYRHYRVNRMSLKAHYVVKELFNVFMEHRKCLPTHVQKRLPPDRNDLIGKARVVADYVSALTDRQALQEHERLFDPKART